MTCASDLFIGVEPKPGRTTRAAIYTAVALAWLICIPFDLCARLGQRSGRDDGDEGADLYGAVEGGQSFHGEGL